MNEKTEIKKTSTLTGSGLSRRKFMGAAAGAATFTYVPKRVLGQPGVPSANNKLNIAAIGAGFGINGNVAACWLHPVLSLEDSK